MFDDNTWLFDGLADAPASMLKSEKRWDFTEIRNPTWRIVAREHLMALLAPTHPAVAPLPMAARRPRSPRFCHIVLNQLTLWLNWLTSEGITELGQVDQDHCDTYLAAHSYTQSQKPRRLLDPGTRKRIVATVQSIATYGDLYTDDRYHPGFTPWDGRPAFEVVGGKPSHENKIQALSEAHLRPLLAAALYTIDVLGPHLAITLDTIAAATAEPARPWGHDATMICRAGDQQQIAWTLPMQARETRSLATLAHFAAMVVTAAITGMRASERAEIVVGSRLDPVDTPGGGRRFRLASRVIKGKQFGGEPDEWIVLPAVDNAVAFAERLLPNMSLTRPRGTRLFGRNWPTMTYLRFRTWVNGPHGRRLGLEPIPDGPCNPRMLRRTLAQEMARRPGGLLAAKVALKHINVVTTEGYTSRPGGSQAAFLAEVEDAEQQHHRGVTADLFRDYQRGITPSGPGARHLLDTFAHIDAALQGQPHAEATVMDNERRIENLLRHTADTLHIGAANYCWFRDPAQALCLRMAGTPTASKPLAGMCDSGRCPQATHHPCHRPVWQDRASTYQVFLDNPRIPDGEKQRLRPEHARTLTVLHQIPGARA